MRIRVLLTVICALTVATGARAQAWDVPSFLPPRPGEDIGAYLTSQGDFGIEGIWRQRGNLNLGLRIGYVDFDPADGAVTAAAESWGEVITVGPEFPLDVTWTAGVGAGFNGGTMVEVPVGLSIGRTFVLDPVTIQPYAHPRIALVILARDDDTDSEIEGLFDLGADVQLTEDWKVRLGVTLGGDFEAAGVGLAYRFGRGAVVR